MSATVATESKGGKSGANNNNSNRRHGHGGKPQDRPEKGERKSQSQAQTPKQSPQQTLQEHPLNRKWTLWYDSPSTYNTENWELSLVPIMTVGTVEEFFVMLRYMKPLHDLRTSSQYHFFEDGVKPMWEDPTNKEGGKIWVNIDIPSTPGDSITTPAAEGTDKKAGDASSTSPASAGKSELDQLWERVLMAVVGEYLEPSTDTEKKEGGTEKPQIVGVVMAKRKYHNRLALWIRDAANSAAIETIKKKLKGEASLPASSSLVFTKHGEGNGKS